MSVDEAGANERLARECHAQLPGSVAIIGIDRRSEIENQARGLSLESDAVKCVATLPMKRRSGVLVQD